MAGWSLGTTRTISRTAHAQDVDSPPIARRPREAPQKACQVTDRGTTRAVPSVAPTSTRSSPPSLRARSPRHAIGQVERAEPGSFPLNFEGRQVQGEERARLAAQVADQYLDDPVGDEARRAVAAACSPYRRRVDGTDEERLFLLGLGDPAGPLTPLSDIPSVAGGPYLSAPPSWGGALGVAVAARCGAFDEPEMGEPGRARRLGGLHTPRAMARPVGPTRGVARYRH
jgi:hypothetical protein